MVRRIKGFWGSLGLVMLSLYCRGVLAAQGAVNAGGAVTSTQSPQTAVAPATVHTPGVPVSIPVPAGQFNQRQVMIGSLAGIGRLFVMVAFFWLLIDVMRKLGGGKPKFIKPLILGGVGIAIAYVVPAIMK